MDIKFDFGKFAQNMQTLGSDMLKNGVLLASTRRMPPGGVGFYAPSIWGCTGGLPGNSLYGFPLRTNPYLVDMGLDAARQRAEKYFNEAPFCNPTGIRQQTTADPTMGKEFFENLNAQKEFTFVTDKWQELNSKGSQTPEEQAALVDAYRDSAKEFGKSYTSYLDQEYGNKDGEMTLDEYTTYLVETLVGKDASTQNKANVSKAAQEAFKKLDLDGNNKLDAKDMAAVMVYIDTLKDNSADGKITPQDYGNVQSQLISDKGEIHESLKSIYNKLFSE